VIITNKKLGNQFEVELANMLARSGFWCTRLAPSAFGQPADLIAAKDKRAYLIDCKVCHGGRFNMSRVEDNQHYAMQMWNNKGNGSGYFALLIDDSVYMLSYSNLQLYIGKKSVLNTKEITALGLEFSRWVEMAGAMV
jgi:Holliday junction resolvase